MNTKETKLSKSELELALTGFSGTEKLLPTSNPKWINNEQD